MKTAVEETIAVRYALHYLGARVEHSSLILGYKLRVVKNASIKDILFKNKHVTIVYHKKRQETADAVLHHVKTLEKNNFSDVLTKEQTQVYIACLVGDILHG